MDENHPDSLLQISDVPCILYCGDISLLQQNALVVVGSRQATTYGLASNVNGWRTESKWFGIVSGMARGIDAAAHRGALEKNGGTIAVLGSGLDRPYPRENIKLFQEISEKGLVISEYPLDTEPVGYNFPIRNRIISGLSQGVFVVARACSV